MRKGQELKHPREFTLKERGNVAFGGSSSHHISKNMFFFFYKNFQWVEIETSFVQTADAPARH